MVGFSIRNRILAAFLILLLLPTSFLVLFNISSIVQLSNSNATTAANALLAEELDYLQSIANNESSRIDEFFAQIEAEVTMLDLYAEQLFKNEVNVTPYQSYWWNSTAEQVVNLRSIPGIDYDPDYDSDISFDCSCYYMPRDNIPGGDPFAWTPELENLLNVSSNLDYMFQNLHEANPNYIWLYMVFSGGLSLFRNYPYDSMEWTMYEGDGNPATTSDDWDPLDPQWDFYWGPIGSTDTVFTSPYWDPVGYLMSAGRQVNNGSTLGVVSVDITISQLNESVIDIDVLDNGYAFLIDDADYSIVHPTQGDQSISITSLEMVGASDDEIAAFNAIVADMVAGDTGLDTYDKIGETWHIAYAPVPTTDYSLAIVVPEGDIIGSVVALQNAILTQSNTQIILLIAILVAAFIIMFAISIAISNRITRPIKELTTLTSLMAEGDLSRELRGDSSEMVPEIGTLHQAFNNLLTSLRFGNTAYYGGDLDRAFTNYTKALELFRTTKNQRGIALAKNNLGNIYRAWGDASAAERHYREAIAIGERIGDVQGLASRYNNLALLRIDQGKNKEALKLLQKAQGYDEKAKNDRGKVLRLANIGLVQLQMGHASTARKHFEESLAIAERIKYDRGIAYARLHLGTLLIKEKDYIEAQSQLDSALTIAKDLVDVSLVAQCLDRLTEVQRKLGFTETADRYEALVTGLRQRMISRKVVLFCIDYSGSMGGPRIRTAIKGARTLLDKQINPQDDVGIVTFSDRSQVVLKLTRMETGRDQIVSTLDSLMYPQGNTAFYDALGDAMKLLAEVKGSEQRWLIALTDGMDNSSRDHSIQVSAGKEIGAKGDKSVQGVIHRSLLNVNLIIIAVGDELQRVKRGLERLCTESPRGKYIGISDRRDTEKAITAAFRQVREILAQTDVEGIRFDRE